MVLWPGVAYGEPIAESRTVKEETGEPNLNGTRRHRSGGFRVWDGKKAERGREEGQAGSTQTCCAEVDVNKREGEWGVLTERRCFWS